MSGLDYRLLLHAKLIYSEFFNALLFWGVDCVQNSITCNRKCYLAGLALQDNADYIDAERLVIQINEDTIDDRRYWI